jgi:pimeloyl-ACP methyl ester carboxylesterase
MTRAPEPFRRGLLGGLRGPASLARKAAARAASVLDEAFLTLIEVEGRGSKKAVSEITHARRIELLDEVARIYAKNEFFSEPDSFFKVRAPIRPTYERVGGAPSAPSERPLTAPGTVDLEWESAFVPYHEGVRAKFLSRPRNKTAYARLISAAPNRPWVVLVHGYMGGQWAFESRQWRVHGLLRAGLNVALFVLPFHAKRAEGGSFSPIFPGGDPRFNNEAFAQAIFDLRALVAHLYAEGASHVGAMGMSLGGFTTSLLATVEPRLSFAAPVIPLASIAEFARARGRLGSSEAEAKREQEALERAIRVVSPLARPLLVPKSRVLVVAADGDRITPIEHARRIADHFGAELQTMHGGHLLQIDRREGLRAVVHMLRREGILNTAPRSRSRRA